MKLDTFVSFRIGGAIFSDFALPMESDRSRSRGATGSYVGVRPRTMRGSTVGAAGCPKFGLSTAVVGMSLSLLFIRLLRSEDRFVTVTGILLRILLVGVSNPHPAFAVVKFVLSPLLYDSPLTGVIGRPAPVFLPPTPFPGAPLIPSLRLLGPGVPTITRFAAASAAVVTRASAAEVVVPVCRRLIIGQLNWVAAHLADAADRVDSN